jgi:hypothetical protein
MSFWRSLEEIPEDKRYAPPQYRTPEAQACVDMIRRMRIQTERQMAEREVMPIVSNNVSDASDTRPVSATLADRIDLRNRDCEEQIAAAIRRFTYQGFIDWTNATAMTKADRDELWNWANRYGAQ